MHDLPHRVLGLRNRGYGHQTVSLNSTLSLWSYCLIQNRCVRPCSCKYN